MPQGAMYMMVSITICKLLTARRSPLNFSYTRETSYGCSDYSGVPILAWWYFLKSHLAVSRHAIHIVLERKLLADRPFISCKRLQFVYSLKFLIEYFFTCLLVIIDDIKSNRSRESCTLKVTTKSGRNFKKAVMHIKGQEGFSFLISQSAFQLFRTDFTTRKRLIVLPNNATTVSIVVITGWCRLRSV